MRLKKFTIIGVVITDYICKECFELEDEDDFGNKIGSFAGKWEDGQNN